MQSLFLSQIQQSKTWIVFVAQYVYFMIWSFYRQTHAHRVNINTTHGYISYFKCQCSFVCQSFLESILFCTTSWTSSFTESIFYLVCNGSTSTLFVALSLFLISYIPYTSIIWWYCGLKIMLFARSTVEGIIHIPGQGIVLYPTVLGFLVANIWCPSFCHGCIHQELCRCNQRCNPDHLWLSGVCRYNPGWKIWWIGLVLAWLSFSTLLQTKWE